ncbi:MAG: hypothetical protein KGL12_04490 [Rhodospirillales bacterium]|nr:hypothetical protein [Rhodospirillales bacterium]
MSGSSWRLGLTIMPEYAQCEGVDAVLRNALDIAGATSITTVPSVMEPALTGGVREPPADGGPGERRLLDRSLWGHRALQVRTAPSFTPDAALYAGSAYGPPRTTELTHRQGHIVGDLLRACRSRNVQTWLQVMAASPPGVRVQTGGPRDEDLAIGPLGSDSTERVDRNGSLASPGLRGFMRALITDLARAYPEADGFKFDWPEYPPYEFRSLFFDFNPHVAAIAARNGIDFEALRARMAALARALPSVARAGGSEVLDRLIRERGLVALLRDTPVLAEHFRLRALLVRDYAEFLADCVRPTGKRLFLQGFPPPWNALSGFDFAALDGVPDAIGMKLYTMHWPMIERNYITRLVEAGVGSPDTVAPLVQAAMATRAAPLAFENLHYPEPHERHPADDAEIAAKIATAQTAVTRSEFWALAHGYGPLEDVRRRLRVAASAGNVNMNRYGYLDDRKLQMIGDECRGAVR